MPHASEEIYGRKGVLKDKNEQGRCLSCNQICEICTDVCPNRANVSVKVTSDIFAGGRQILHIDGMCNECGNCGTFCPHTGNPYRDKLTLFWTQEDFDDSRNTGFLFMGDNRYLVRCEDGSVLTYQDGQQGIISSEMAAMIALIKSDYSYFLVRDAK